MVKVTIYSTPACQFCKLAKKYFDDHKIEYTDIDVSVDHEAAHAAVEKSGQMGVPVIIVEKDGREDVVVGFDQGRLAELLEIRN